MQNAECTMHNVAPGAGALRILHFALCIVAGDRLQSRRGAGQSETSAPTTAVIGRQSLKPVSFPDISGATPSAQKQLREASVSARRDDSERWSF